MEVFRKDVN